MLLSIVITLYNCREYIKRCILSVYNQELAEQDFEVIVINDGSTDGGEKIVEDLAKSHSNLALINQENQGLSNTRNKGIKLAKGLYIEFLDADDYLTAGNMKSLLQIAVNNDLDILVFKTKKIKDDIVLHITSTQDANSLEYSISSVMTGNKAETYVKMPEFIFSVNYILVRKQLYTDLDLSFSPDISFGEDGIVSMQLFYNAKRVIVTDCNAHRYVQRNTSLCHSRDDKTQANRIRCYKKAAIEFNKINETYKERSQEGYNLQRQRINLFLFFYLFGTFTSNIPTNELKASIKDLKANKLYPIGSFEKLGYSGTKHNILRSFCNSGCFFTFAHKVYKLIR